MSQHQDHEPQPPVSWKRNEDPFEEQKPLSFKTRLTLFLIPFAIINVTLLIFGGPLLDSLLSEESSDAGGVTWTCPMHPTVIADKPGACPVCGMDLVPLSVEGAELEAEEAKALSRVSAAPSQKVIGLYETVKLSELNTPEPGSAELELVGRVAFAEDRLAAVTSWIPGRIDKLYVEEEGVLVKKGEALAKVYSEVLLSAQEEYLAALEGGPYAKKLVGASERKLRLYGMSGSQVQRLKQKRKTEPSVRIRTREGGTLTQRYVQEGQYVSEGQVLFEVADLSVVWVELDVPEAKLHLVRAGQKLPFEAVNLKEDASFEGEVTFIHPFVNAATQTVAVRLEVQNLDGKLQPGALVKAKLEESPADASTMGPRIPKSALVRAGQRDLVWVEVGQQTYEPRLVNVGRSVGHFVTVDSGLEGDETLIAKAGFLLDPESPLPTPDNVRMLEALGEAEITGELHHFRHIKEGEYFCPMHPDVVHDEPGTCPKCRMKLLMMTPELANEVSQADPIASLPAGTWYCPMDAEHIQEGPGRCPKCNMKLVEKIEGDGASLVADPIDTVPLGDHYCPMGAEWVQDGPGTCPICGMTLKEKTAHEGHTHQEHQDATQTSGDPIEAVEAGAYYCPMGAEWVQDGPGKCPICGMDIVLKEGERTKKASQHPNHPANAKDPIATVSAGKHYCPMGAEWVQDEPGTCPLCGMNLKLKEEDTHEH